jgi:hypothetical protein
LGVSSDLKVFLGTPAVTVPASGPTGRPRTRLVLPPDVTSVTAKAWAGVQPARAWRLVSWRNGANRPWRARFLAQRVTPAHDWRERRLAPEVWLLCERDLGPTPRTKYYLVDLPATASLRDLVHLAHQRWAIEQQYQELKDELGLDHFEGRSLRGWEPTRRPDRAGLQLSARRTSSAAAHAAHTPAGPRRDAGCPDGAFLHHSAEHSQVDAQSKRHRPTDLDEVTMQY